jgi:site-specific recombinase XerD
VKRGWKPNIVSTYVSVRYRLVEAFGGERLEATRPRDVAAYIASLTKQGYGAAIVRRDIAVLHSIYRSAKAAELVDSNPCEGAELPRSPEFQPWILAPEEVRSILRAFTDERARVLFLTLELTGIRQHEATQLRWRDVDLVDGLLRVVKSKSKSGVRSIALSRP